LNIWGEANMAILIDIDPVKTLITSPDAYPQVAENQGFKLYWSSAGRDPVQVATGLSGTNTANLAADLDKAGLEGKSMLTTLGRVSGVSIEQQILRHLPGNPFVDAQVVFVPGEDLPFSAGGSTVAINVFALEQRGNKLFLGDCPLLSFLANRIHQLCTNKIAPEQTLTSCSTAVSNFLLNLLKEGSATLFFTMPVFGTVFQLWEKAEGQRDTDLQLLRQYLRVKEGDKAPLALARELEQSFGLTGEAAFTAKYPLGTWMCQVIESAFGRARLVELFQHPGEFLGIFEEARMKFGLAEKYSLEVSK